MYGNSGVYTVILVASNAAGSDTIISTVTINLAQPPTVSMVVSALGGGTFQFEDFGQNAVSWLWDFGDGGSSTLQNPVYTYANEGTYTVVLTAWNACDTVTTVQSVTYLAPPQAGFTVPDTVYACQTAQVFFTNTSSGTGLAYQWFFPGGSPPSSVLPNPLVTYPVSGVYPVTLVATNVVGADTVSGNVLVEVLEYPTAAFDLAVLADGLVQVVNQSQQALTYTWDFGDGSPIVFTTDASHQYTQSGVYVVTLVAANPCGAAVFQQTVEVMVSGVHTFDPGLPGLVYVYPNPTEGPVTVDVSEGKEQLLEVRVYSADGRLWVQQPAGNAVDGVRFDLGMAPTGAYMLELVFTTGRVGRTVLRL
jgi:PKD repeat protein